jgi:hypothetical protein
MRPQAPPEDESRQVSRPPRLPSRSQIAPDIPRRVFATEGLVTAAFLSTHRRTRPYVTTSVMIAALG